MRRIHEATPITFPLTVNQLACAVGCSRSAIYRAIHKRQLEIDPVSVPTRIVGGIPPEPAVRNYRCPMTPDMFDSDEANG